MNATLDGNRKALIIGINYTGQKAELKGCTNDAHVMYKFLTDTGYFPNQILVLAEDSRWQPTKANIINGCRWLTNDAKPGDTLFFHFSGHGTRVVDLQDGDEKDGFDEAIVPVDYRQAGLIIDDDLFRLLVRPLPKGCRLTSIMDCCHSGSGLDLTYSLVMTDEKMQKFLNGLELSMTKILQHQALAKHLSSFKGSVDAVPYFEEFAKQFGEFLKQKQDDSNPEYQTVSDKMSEAEVILFAGCMDTQTSADVNSLSSFELPPGYGAHTSGGACTMAFVETIHKRKDISFVDLLCDMRRILAERGFTQVPQMSSSFEVPLAAPFRIVN